VLDNVSVDSDTLLGNPGQGQEILEWLEQRANIGHCALQVGVTEAAMRRTADFLGERKQFGVALGSFQALAMRMADSYIDVEAIRSTYWLALWRLSEGLDARAEVRAAKWWACDAAHRVVSTSQHLHGGIGADVEYPIHRFFLMAKQISYSLGNASKQLEKLGQLLAADDSLGFRALEV
jgi:alkylation response protein AidB-like acyl-CoA dehydrogenase